MRVARGAAVSGEMFRARKHAVRAVRPHKRRRVARDDLGIGGKTSAFALDDRVVGMRVEIDDRREVQVEPETRERLRRGFGMAKSFRGLVDAAEFLVGNTLGKTIGGLQSVHASALLID